MSKVLLVLDSKDLAAILSRMLSTEYQLKICDASIAVEVIEDFQPDALILDLFLPGTNGFEILRRATYQTPIIILLTVLVTTSILDDASPLNINYIFLKPFRLSALTKRLYEFLPTHIIKNAPPVSRRGYNYQEVSSVTQKSN